MRQQLTNVQYDAYKKTISTLIKVGYSRSQIRDIMHIGNGTVKFIDETKTFQEYCKLRDDTMAQYPSTIKRKAKMAQKRKKVKPTHKQQELVVAKEVEKKVKLSAKTKQRLSSEEAPANIQALIASNINDLRKWLQSDFTENIVDKFKNECLNDFSEQLVAMSQPAEDLAGKADGQSEDTAPRKRWWQ